MEKEHLDESLNVLGTELELCSEYPKTGFYRDGNCTTVCDRSYGAHET